VAAISRSVDRVTTKQQLGPDSQVDDKAIVIAPVDPSLTDPFLMMAEDWFSKPGFEWHPHRGIETVTTVVGGVLEHGDNLGNAGALEPGDVQWMTAGRGIIHRELAYRDEHAHTLQLWLNLPATDKLTDTRYQDLLAGKRPRIECPGTVIDVVSGTVDAVTGPALNHVDVQGTIVTLDPTVALDYPLPAAHRAFVHVLTGAAEIAGQRVVAGSTGWSDPVIGAADSVLSLRAVDGDSATTVMIYSGTPLREPIAFGGPFVMNSRAQIAQAFVDFHAGMFGDVPRQARLAYDR
jgi:redox-sensitive bicupin YhaK (pirin superfamily)